MYVHRQLGDTALTQVVLPVHRGGQMCQAQPDGSCLPFNHTVARRPVMLNTLGPVAGPFAPVSNSPAQPPVPAALAVTPAPQPAQMAAPQTVGIMVPLPQASPIVQWLQGQSFGSVPNWALLAGGAALLFALGHHHGRRR